MTKPRVVAYMPIRLNSKRVPEKSVKLLGGKPLCDWLLKPLLSLGLETHVYCSDPEAVARHTKINSSRLQFTKRPALLDGDGIKGIDIYRSFAEQVPADIYVLTHCTSPFLGAASIRKAIEAVETGPSDSALLVAPVQTFCWYQGKALNFELPRPQTQGLEPVYYETSGAYVYRREVLEQGDRSTLDPTLIPIEWPETEDIDQPTDFSRCEAILPFLKAEHLIDS